MTFTQMKPIRNDLWAFFDQTMGPNINKLGQSYKLIICLSFLNVKYIPKKFEMEEVLEEILSDNFGSEITQWGWETIKHLENLISINDEKIKQRFLEKIDQFIEN